MTKTAIIGGKEYRMRASALTPRLYRAFFKRDIIRDMQGLITVYNKVVEVQKKEDATEEEQNAVSMELLDHLEVFENTAWLFCKEAGEAVGDNPEAIGLHQLLQNLFIIILEGADSGRLQPALVAACAMGNFQIGGVDNLHLITAYGEQRLYLLQNIIA